MAQYVLDRVLSVAGSDAVDGKVLFLADQIVDPSLSFTSETEDIVDATNNVVMVLENGRGATFSASNSFFNTQILAAQVGGEVESGNATIDKYKIVTLGEGGQITLGVATIPTKTVTVEGATTTVFDGKVYALTDDGSLWQQKSLIQLIPQQRVRLLQLLPLMLARLVQRRFSLSMPLLLLQTRRSPHLQTLKTSL